MQLKPICLFVLSAILLASQALAQEPKKITQHDAMEACTKKIQPDYPPVARQLKLQGNVELEAEIGEEGSVEHVKSVSGSPVFTKAATEALMKWKFKPFLENGKAVKVVVTLSFNFSL